jgi:WD40 repeat protein
MNRSNNSHPKVPIRDWVSKSKSKIAVMSFKHLAIATGVIALFFIGIFFYDMMILEPSREIAAELEKQIDQATEDSKAHKLYQYMSGEIPYPPLERNLFLGKTLSGFKNKADEAMNRFWQRKYADAAKHWLTALKNTSNETDAKRFYAILSGHQKDPNINQHLKGYEKRAKKFMCVFWQKRAATLEQKGLTRIKAGGSYTKIPQNIDEGILLSMLAALKRNNELPPSVVKLYQKRSYNSLIGTVRKPFTSTIGKGMVYNSNSEQILAEADRRSLFIIDTFTGNIIKELKTSDYPNAGCFCSDGNEIAVGSGSLVEIIDITSEKKRIVAKDLDGAYDPACSPVYKTIIAYNNGSKIIIQDTKTNNILKSIKINRQLFSLNFSPNGKSLLSTHRNGDVIIWDVEAGVKKLSFEGHTEIVRRGKFSPNGQCVATTSIDNTVRIWDAITGEELNLFKYGSSMMDVTFSNNSQYWLFGAQNNNGTYIAIYETETGKEVLKIKAHNFVILNLDYAPDGKTFASRSADGTLRIWDATNLTPEYFSRPPSGSPQEMWRDIQQKLCLSVDENDEIRPLWPKGFSEQEGWTGEPIPSSVYLDSPKLSYSYLKIIGKNLWHLIILKIKLLIHNIKER